MAIRRFTFEVDDGEQQGPTRLPAELQDTKTAELTERGHSTSVAEPDDEPSSGEAVAPASPVVGRTVPDLVHQYVDTPRVMATLLVLVSCVVFVPKIDTISDFKLPLVLASALNLIWFGGEKVRRWLRSKEEGA